MSSDLTTISGQLTIPEAQVSLMDIRRSPERFPRIGSLTREAAVLEMSKIVTQAFLYKGQAADPANVQFISCGLVDELQSDLDHLGTGLISLAEISRIVKRSVLQDEMYGISIASLYKVIVTYIKGEGHRLCLALAEEKKKTRDSVIAPMLQAYAGAMVKNSKP